MFDWIKTKWQNFWDWCSNSGTILLGRIQMGIGFVISAIAATDWSPLYSLFGTTTEFNHYQLLGIGTSVALNGLITEWVRRRNTVTVDDRLIPANLTKTKQ